MGNTKILETVHLSAGYGKGRRQHVVLRNVNVTLATGQLVILIGPNGAGKSTLMRTITTGQTPLDGIVKIASTSVARLSKHELSHLVSIVTTDTTQAGALTVRELVALGRQPYTGIFGRLDGDDKQFVNQAIASVGLSHLAHRYIADLSDGERQKAMIAKALAQNTPIIVLDEPTAFLDVVSRVEVLKLLSGLAHEQDKAILLSTHDVVQSLIFADGVWAITKDSEGNSNLSCGSVTQMIDNGTVGAVMGVSRADQIQSTLANLRELYQ